MAAAAMVVMLPFGIPAAIVTWAAGEPGRAGLFVVRGYLSALTAMLLAASTRTPDLLAGLEALHAPRFLLEVMQFLIRYVVLFIEEAATMRQAALSRVGAITPAGAFRARNGCMSAWVLGFRQAAAAVAVLFARAHGRATAVHRAMVSRGFEGHLPALGSIRF